MTSRISSPESAVPRAAAPDSAAASAETLFQPDPPLLHELRPPRILRLHERTELIGTVGCDLRAEIDQARGKPGNVNSPAPACRSRAPNGRSTPCPECFIRDRLSGTLCRGRS